MAKSIIYVAPYGMDTNPGTLGEPVKTLNEALSRTRIHPYVEKRIIVREGSYYEVSLTFTSEDANLSIEAYPGEQPVLYGGLPVTLWEKEGEFLSAPLDGVGDRSRDFRMIEVNQDFRQRARLPETGAFCHRNEFDVDWMSTFGGGWRRKPTEAEMAYLKYKKEDIGPWLDVNNTEVTVYHEWDESLLGLKCIDKESEMLQFSNRPGHPPGAFAGRNENAKTYVVWNVKEGMQQPGQWYLDRTHSKLVYWPLPSENPDSLHVVAPSQKHILYLQAGAKHLRFQGLTIACAATQLVAGGFGALEASAAISGEDVQHIVFEKVTVRFTGGWACRLAGKDIRLAGCHIHHTGAGGIHLKGEGIILENTRIHDVGLIYQSAVAVSCQGSGNIIRHNEIHDTPYSGIVSVSPDTAVNGNMLYNTMTFMKDGAAIYIAMHSKNVTVSGNVVFSRSDGTVRRYAYYLDERCEECFVENNLAVNLRFPMLSHMTSKSSFINNIFLDKGPQTVYVFNSYGLVFERNILAAHSIEIQSPQGNPQGLPSEYDTHEYMKSYSTADGITSLKNNIFHSTSSSHNGPGSNLIFKEYLHYKMISEYPIEEKDGNTFADPMLKDPAAGDFSFEVKSRAQSLGIRPLSFSDAGCTGSFSLLFNRFYH